MVTSKPFPHVDHAALALAIPLFELLALCGKGFDEWRTEAIYRAVTLNEDAVGGLEAFREGGACNLVGLVGGIKG